MSKIVFISHRHADERIASALNYQLQSWHLGRHEIFQSSDAQGGAGIGGKLNQELLKALSEARLLLLVYTIADVDWSYCMWECGVATDPRSRDTPTRVIVFRMNEDVPQVLRDLVSVRTSEESDIKRFVYQFFREKGWVVEDNAFKSDIADRVLDDYAKKLYSALLEVTPKLKAQVKRRWDVLTLRFDASSVQEILQSHKDQRGISEDTLNLVQRKGRVVFDFGQALMRFGYDANVRDLTLSHLIQRWCDEFGRETENATALGWIEELCAELLRAFRNRPAQPSWSLMRSQLFPGWWFYPVVSNQRIEGDGSMEFDIHMYRLPGALPAKVDLPSG